MTENPNADYHKLLNDKPEVQFTNMYEEALVTISQSLGLPLELTNVLRQKRLFGIEKYGEDCFQANLTNAMNSPVFNHLADELVDAFNYALHLYYTSSLRGDKETEVLLGRVIEGLFLTAANLDAAFSSYSGNTQQVLNPDEVQHLHWVTAVGNQLKASKQFQDAMHKVQPLIEDTDQDLSQFLNQENSEDVIIQTEPLAWALQKHPEMKTAYDSLYKIHGKTHTPDVTNPTKPFAVRYCKCGSANLLVQKQYKGPEVMGYRYVCADCQFGKKSTFIEDHFEAAKYWAQQLDEVNPR